MKSTRGEEEHSQSTRSVQIGWSGGHYSFQVLPRPKNVLTKCAFPRILSSNMDWNILRMITLWSPGQIALDSHQSVTGLQLPRFSKTQRSIAAGCLMSGWWHVMTRWQLMSHDDKLPWQSRGPWLINIRSPPDDRGKLATPWQNMTSSMQRFVNIGSDAESNWCLHAQIIKDVRKSQHAKPIRLAGRFSVITCGLYRQ